MKKTILILLACICFVLAGCSTGEVGLVQNSDGSVLEYYYVPFPEQELMAQGISLDTTRNEILPSVKQELDEMFSGYLSVYRQQVTNNEEYTQEEKDYLINGVTIKSNLPSDFLLVANYYTGIRYEINCVDSTCYNAFKNINESLKEERITETTSNLFTTTTKVTKDPIFDKLVSEALTIGKACVNRADEIMAQKLGDEQWSSIKADLNYSTYANKFAYTYVVPTARVHSNATTVQKGEDGYYYHTWEINIDNLDEEGNSIVNIQYWTVTANKAVWYVLAVIVAATIITTVIIVAKKQEKRQKEKFDAEK